MSLQAKGGFRVSQQTGKAVPKRLPIFLHGDEPERLFAAAVALRDRTLILVGFYLGLRVSEIVCRQVEDIDLDRALCVVRKGKGDKDRAVPIPVALLPALRAWIADRTTGWLFPSTRSQTGHLSARAFQKSIKLTAARAGISRHVTPHKLRHSYATALLHSGADIIEVRDLLGHSSVATTQIYLHTEPERLRAAVDRLRFGAGTPGQVN